MIKEIIMVCLMLTASCASLAQEPCQPLDLEVYKKTIATKEATDKLLPKLPNDAVFSKPVIENCYVRLRVSFPEEYEYDRQYLFDPRGELVDVYPSAGPNIMTCKSTVKNNVDYFEKLLTKKRMENKNLPTPLALPKRYTVMVFNCLVSLRESFQDDKQKPSLARTWVFDHNENVVSYSDLVRNPRILDDDKQFK